MKVKQQKTKRRDGGNGEDAAAGSGFTVKDRRHWALSPEEREAEGQAGETPTQPTIVDEYRSRAEAAEAKLHEYIEAFKQAQREQEQFRERLDRDVERRVELKFGELIGELLETVDHLELALGHVEGVAEAAPLADGVAMARDRFLAALEKSGVEKITPDGEPFDPHVAEAMSIEPVDSAEREGQVTRTLRPGYRLGDLVIRPARVIVGKHQG